ncbi:virulence factor [Kiloniella sp. EL199]|uniref:virulence factor n=1 Tax=Kiloniella sp. EL199 TaxID=2107581 RepID=UPI000EA39287|nr:virulence factor [Kiloniella sp. EL199]
MAKLTLVYWRDIPAQIIVKAGRKNAKVQLHERFEKAIDRAAMKAKLKDSDSYLEHWRRSVPTDCGDDLDAEAQAMATQIENEYTDEKLDALVQNGGLSNDS